MRQAFLSACVGTVALALPTARAAAQWEPVGLGGSGGLFALAVSPLDPRLMMVNCDMGAAYVSRDAGRTWQMIHHRMLHGNTRCSPVYHPTVPNRLYAVSGGTNEIRVSDDAGTNWRPLTKTRPPWSAPIVLLYVPPDRPDCLFVGAGEAAYVTLTAGASWQRCESVTGKVVAVLAGRAKAKYHFIATGEGIFRSTDLAKGYAPCRTGLPPGAVCTGPRTSRSSPTTPGPSSSPPATSAGAPGKEGCTGPPTAARPGRNSRRKGVSTSALFTTRPTRGGST